MSIRVSITSIAGDTFSDAVRAWNLEQPSGSDEFTESRLVVRGWVVPSTDVKITSVVIHWEGGETAIYPIYISRPDVASAILNDKSQSTDFGFNFEIPLREGSLQIGFQILDRIEWAGLLILTTPQVIRGKEDWLFLGGDTNLSASQHLGSFHYPDKLWLDKWDDILRSAETIAAEKSMKWCFLIAPSKEEILPDLYPFQAGTNRPIDLFVNRFSNRNVVFPVKELKSNRHQFYDRVDTHWTDSGARIACEAALETFGLKTNDLNIPHRYYQIPLSGDLGDKLCQSQITLRNFADWDKRATLSFDNHVMNHGRIRIYDNPSAPIKETLLIFGGSSTISGVKYLSEVFQRTLYIHSTAKMDMSIINYEKPRYLMLQTNQRFIVHPPSVFGDHFAQTPLKMEFSSEAEKDRYLHSLFDVDGTNRFYADHILSRFKMRAVTGCVSKGYWGNKLSGVSKSGDTYLSKRMVVEGKEVSSIRLAHAGSYFDNEKGEMAAPAFSVSDTIEFSDGSMVSAYYDGSAYAKVHPGEVVLSDPVPIPIHLQGEDAILIRSKVTSDGTGGWPVSTIPRNIDKQSFIDKSSGDFIYEHNSFGPVAVLGHAVTGPVNTIALFGSSIPFGKGDDSTSLLYGFAERALANRCGVIRCAAPNSALSTMNPNYTPHLMILLQKCQVTHVLSAIGCSDIKSGATLKSLMDRLNSFWGLLHSRGYRVIAVTYPPVTSGRWEALESQVPHSSTITRMALNDWIRGRPHDAISDVWDLDELLRSTERLFCWRVDGGAWTADGEHMNTRAHQFIGETFRHRPL